MRKRLMDLNEDPILTLPTTNPCYLQASGREKYMLLVEGTDLQRVMATAGERLGVQGGRHSLLKPRS